MKQGLENKKTLKNKIFMWIIPFIFIGLTGVGFFILNSIEKAPEALPAQIKNPPAVDVVLIDFYEKPVEVILTGTVSPLYRTQISSEVGGKIVYVSPKLVNGGYFKKGEVILKIDEEDYKDAVVQSKAEFAEVSLEVIKEKELAKQAKEDWKELGQGLPTDLALRKPQIYHALSMLEAAKSRLEKSKRELEKTKIKAPFECMVSSKSVSVGTFVTQGSFLFEIFNIDVSEIRLAMSLEDSFLIDIPKPGVMLGKNRKVEIFFDKNGVKSKREGYISRLEAETDPETRFQYLVVRIDDPYSVKNNFPVCKIGDFAEVKISGKNIKNSVLIPAIALLNDNKVIKVNDENMIFFEKVKILKRNKDNVLVTGSFKENEKIIVSKLEFPVEGTIVRINGEKNAQ
jgi:RND family efflux transporter MFP subunit